MTQTLKMIEFSIEDDQILCRPLEDLSADNVPGIHDLIVQKLSEIETWKILIMDCLNVKTLDSAGVNLIIGLFKKAELMDRGFKISNCNESIVKVLNLFKLDRQFLVE